MEDYKEHAKQVRLEVLSLIHKAQTSHIGSNLSIIDVATVLYDVINLPSATDSFRDRVIWSKGWAAATAYVLLKDRGILSADLLESYGRDGGLLGLVESTTPGIEASTGSMGHGLPMGVGMSLAAHRGGELWHTYVIMSDGEMDCGTTWECALLAAHHKLHNLKVIVDVNGWQAMDRTKNVLGTDDLFDKWEAFGWHVISIDGHDYGSIKWALEADFEDGKPVIILAKTIKGKGVPFMEDKLEWHYKNISDGEYDEAVFAVTHPKVSNQGGTTKFNSNRYYTTTVDPL